MLTLHGSLLEVEAAPATEESLLRVHTPEHLESIRNAAAEAQAAGGARRLASEAYVSGASWDAGRAAVGTALTGVEVVLRGEARNAFCAARPPGRAAFPDAVGGFSLFNSVAIAARHLGSLGVSRVLVVDWAGTNDSAIAAASAGDPGIFVLSVCPAPGPATHGMAEGDRVRAVGLPEGSGGAVAIPIFEAALDAAIASWAPEFILVSAGLDLLAGDPVGRLSVEPSEIHPLTRIAVERAERACGGRLVSVLDGGYEAAPLGTATVQHLRALSGLPPA